MYSTIAALARALVARFKIRSEIRSEGTPVEHDDERQATVIGQERRRHSSAPARRPKAGYEGSYDTVCARGCLGGTSPATASKCLPIRRARRTRLFA